MQKLTGATVAVSLVLAAWAATLCFWLVVGAWMGEQRWRYGAWIQLYPAAMYLGLPYTESLFVLGLVGFLSMSDRWASERARRWLWASAAVVFGAIMTSTRLVGVAFLVYPVVLTWSAHSQSWRKWREALLARESLASLTLAAGGLLGFVGFVVYCRLAFGNPWIYFETVPRQWGAHGSAWRVFSPLAWWSWLNSAGFPDKLGTLITASLFVIQGFWLRTLWKTRAGADRRSFALAVTAASGFLLLIWARTPFDLVGMLRYLLSVMVPLLASVAFSSTGQKRWERLWQKRPERVLGMAAVLLALQMHFIVRYLLSLSVS